MMTEDAARSCSPSQSHSESSEELKHDPEGHKSKAIKSLTNNSEAHTPPNIKAEAEAEAEAAAADGPSPSFKYSHSKLPRPDSPAALAFPMTRVRRLIKSEGDIRTNADAAFLINKAVIDEDVLQEVVNMGVERNQLIDSLQNSIQNQGAVAYNLMLDKNLHLCDGYLGAEMPDRNEIIPHVSTGGPAMPILGYGLPSHIDQGDPIGHGLTLETTWTLGLQSKAHPQDIMKEVLKLLQTLNIGWKIIDHYAMKCRWFPQFLSPIDSQCNNRELLQTDVDDRPASIAKIGNGIHKSQNNVVKFEVQLFKTNEEKYLLDLQRVQGPHFLFLDLCAVFLSQLQACEPSHGKQIR